MHPERSQLDDRRMAVGIRGQWHLVRDRDAVNGQGRLAMRPDTRPEVISHEQMAGQGRDVPAAEADRVARVLPELVLTRRQPVEPDQGQPAVR
jgi:hypothetical protein